MAGFQSMSTWEQHHVALPNPSPRRLLLNRAQSMEYPGQPGRMEAFLLPASNPASSHDRIPFLIF